MVAFSQGRRVTVVVLVIVALVAALVIGYIVRRGSDSEPADIAADEPHGPLCDALPAGDDPGGPAQLAGLDAAVALTWIPVLTIFEAGTRAAGLTTELADADGLTIFAPSDDAFLLRSARRPSTTSSSSVTPSCASCSSHTSWTSHSRFAILRRSER